MPAPVRPGDEPMPPSSPSPSSGPIEFGGRRVPPAVLAELGVLRDGLAEQIAAADRTARALIAQWHLEADDAAPVRGGAHALVLPVRRGDTRLVLRVPVVDVDKAEAVAVAVALRTWGGEGAVLLAGYDADSSAMLLERLDASCTLARVALPGAAEVVGTLLRRLAVPAPPDLDAPTTSQIAQACARARSVRGEADLIADGVAEAIANVARELAADDGPRSLVHGDLHDGNVLGGRREPWLAVDPKVRVGSPEIAVAELMWTRAGEAPDAAALRELLGSLVHAAVLDEERARAWALVRALDYLRWGLTHGLTVDPPRCARVIGALA